jgi:hypothetical protein
MALSKPIERDDGIVTVYHRILSLESYINSHTAISVLSYVNAESRQKDGSYNFAITYNTDYHENMTIEQAYSYLKTLPEFEGAEDV